MKKWTVMMLVLALCAFGAGAPAAAETAESGLLRAAVLYDISTMDVARTTDDYMIPLNVFDRLFETRMEAGEARVVNSLCTEYSVSGDGLTYTFTLREGVVFSNGSALTASDVGYSFARLLAVNDQNTDIAEEIAGAEAVRNGESQTLSGIEIIDDTHLRVTLNAPNAGFLAELSSPAMSIVDAETMAEVSAFGTEPADTIGSGPYRVTEWAANDHYTLEYNEKYWGPKPSALKVVVQVIPDANTQNLMFQNGELDLIDLASLDSVVVDTVYKANWPDSIVSTPKVGLSYLLLNNQNEYLKDARVRRAIGLALDVDQIIAGLYSGNAVREAGIIPTGIWGHNDALAPIPYDPDAARALIREAGYQPGEIHFELAMDSAANGTIQLVNYSISQMLEAVGIKAEVRSYDHAAWLDLRNSGGMDSFLARWGMDYNDPANIMVTFFGSAEKSRIRSLNYQDEAVMARVAAASALIDDDERMKEYQALEEKIIGEDTAWIPLLEDLHLYCIGARVERFIPHWAGFSDFYAADVTLK